jgi:hypothetical protein
MTDLATFVATSITTPPGSAVMDFACSQTTGFHSA